MKQRMTVVVLHFPNKTKKRYRIANKNDQEIYRKASEYLQQKLSKHEDIDSLLPNEELPPIGTLGFGVRQYGMTKWRDLFNFRQQLALITFLERIKANSRIIERNHLELIATASGTVQYSTIIITYLTIILGRLADKNANLVVYNAYGEKIEHVFGRTALPHAWDFAELNVFSGANGDWLHQMAWVIRFLANNSWKPVSTASVFQASATSLPFPNEFFDAILTDPPYYDNVPYSDLSDFFYVWFKRSLGDLPALSDLFSTPLTPKSKEIVANKGRQENPREFFERMISKSFQESFRVLKPEGIAIVVYAHKSSAGWETMLKSLTQAGFVVTASWPIHTEMKTRLRAKTSAALASSIYLICRKLPQKDHGYFSEIQQELEIHIQEQLEHFWSEGIRGGDFFISAIGPSMEILSKFKSIELYSGEKVTFHDQLQSIRTIITNFLLKRILHDQGRLIIDKMSQFYLVFRWTFQDTSVDFGEVQKLSQACGIEFEFLLKKGLIDKKGARITVLDAQNRREIDPEDPSLVSIMHRLILAWKEGERDKIDIILDSSDQITEYFWLFCQAIAECLPPKNQEKQLLEGFLVSKHNF